MKMPGELAEAFNEQISMELASSTAYLQMSAYFEAQNLTGMASWMRMQSEEEREHAIRFFEFVVDRGNTVRVGGLDAPQAEFANPEQVFETALEQEQAVTKAIHDLYRLATDHGDLGSFPFLQSFIQEQNEEEATVETILERVRLAGNESSAILLLDSELGTRT
ncbi:MAG: ferritin [Actinobacteria bacterium]|nr:ferritin [Actinomycetota bacterium]